MAGQVQSLYPSQSMFLPPFKVFVIGASGGTVRLVLEELKSRNIPCLAGEIALFMLCIAHAAVSSLNPFISFRF